MLADRRYCYPLTITDFASRYLLCCEALATTKEIYAFTVFERAFKDFGLPRAIRSDNGVPFASNSAFFGLCKLSVWWLRLGIGIERIKPGHPQQNGRHERMHLTLKNEATKPPGKNFLQQQAKFDHFSEVFNHDRPHQALNMQYPAELYTPSPRPYTGPTRSCITRSTIDHHRHPMRPHVLRQAQDQSQWRVRRSERRRPRSRREVWLISFMHYDLGFFDDETGRVEVRPNPFSAKVSTMCPV